MRLRTPLPSSFDNLIDDLFAREDELGRAPRHSRKFSLNSLEAAWDLAAKKRSGISSHAPQPRRRNYGDDDTSDLGLPEAFLDPNKILLELGLTTNVSEADISILRREFALRNHPDRVPSELRPLATQRMMIANDLMDRYVARLRKSCG
ncbi:molecular chaperone DnaJ [Hyphomicrobium sp. 99]|uniref:molecular chaperone DnaJ n=1 Tax=Hyphomicrobium sp. 99 TaxID=1163419 RepID=UPI0005F7993F|nr:molecular chaperone DnaJ [Hyphomicrobium sp. 99]